MSTTTTTLPVTLAAELDEAAQAGNIRDQYVALTILKRQMETAVKRAKDEIAARQDAIIEDLAERGDRGFLHEGSGKTVSIRRQIWARAAQSKDDACDALIAAGLGDYVERGFNAHSLSAHFRELAQDGQSLDALLPEELRDHIALTEDHTLSVAGR